jgi:hypothetical protein
MEMTAVVASVGAAGLGLVAVLVGERVTQRRRRRRQRAAARARARR